MRQEPPEERIIVLAPADNDATTVVALLRARGLEVEVGRDAPHCHALISEGAGALLLTEESLGGPDRDRIFASLEAQPAWSELPVLVLTTGGSDRMARLLELADVMAGRVTFLERPVNTEVLFRTMHLALNARRRQYHVRRLLEDFQRRQQEQEEARCRLEHELAERKRAEEALRKSEALFRAMAENLPQLAWIARPDGWITWFNRRWLQYTGTTSGEMEGWGWLKLHHPEHVERVSSLFHETMKSGTDWEDTFPLKGADGSHRWFLARAFPIRDAEAVITHWFGTFTDIGTLRETQEALRAAEMRIHRYAEELEHTVYERTAALQETVEELEAFSYSIAHDMRGPLRAMMGYADLLSEEHSAELDEEGTHYLQRIHASAQRLDRLILDVLNYSQISRQKLPVEAVDLRQLISEMLESYPNLTTRRSCIEFATEIPLLRANRAALAQVLSNLTENALKFVAPGVKPHVRIRAESTKPPPGFMPRENGWVRVWVEDNGIGLEPVARTRLFQISHRGMPRLHEGTGMGLAIARKAIERMGGTIGVESVPGKGSRFWFVLPAAPLNRSAKYAES